jgi:hypothetical protein
MGGNPDWHVTSHTKYPIPVWTHPHRDGYNEEVFFDPVGVLEMYMEHCCSEDHELPEGWVSTQEVGAEALWRPNEVCKVDEALALEIVDIYRAFRSESIISDYAAVSASLMDFLGSGEEVEPDEFRKVETLHDKLSVYLTHALRRHLIRNLSCSKRDYVKWAHKIGEM